MVEYTLQHLIYGKPVIANTPGDVPDVLAISDDLTVPDISGLIGRIPLSPLVVDSIQASQALALVHATINDHPYMILARAHYQRESQMLPVRELIFIPVDTMPLLQDFDALIASFDTPVPIYNVVNSPLSPVVISQTSPPGQDKQVTILKTLLESRLDDQFEKLLWILDKAIQHNVMIRHFPVDQDARMLLIRGLRLLLPASIRHLLTFSTHTDSPGQNLPRVSFNDSTDDTGATIIDWQHFEIDAGVDLHPYVEQLRNQWQDDVIELVTLIMRYEQIVEHLSHDNTTLTGILTAVADRHQLDIGAMQGAIIPTTQILGVFESDVPMSVELQTAYVILLLESNFENRDTTIARAVASVLVLDDELDRSIQPFLNTSIEEQPDAVYNFVRAHLNSVEQDSLTQRWLQRLHESAQNAMTVAIESGDPATIRSWLTLISREPLHYQLSDIIRNAINDVLLILDDDSDLAQEILIVAVRRQPEMLDTLLANENLTTTLPQSLRAALLDHDATAIETLSTESRDLFLLGLKRAVDARVASVTSQSVRALWQYYLQQPANTLPAEYRPVTLIDSVMAYPACFINGAPTTLLTLTLEDRKHDEMFYLAVKALDTQDDIAPALAQALKQSDRKPDAVLDVLSTLLGQDAITPQRAVDTLALMLGNREWDDKQLPYIEQLARLMSQHPDTTTGIEVLEQLSERSAIHKNEQMLKVSHRRLLEAAAQMVSEQKIVERIITLRRDSQWSTAGKTTLIRWWRTFASEQGTGQLQKIDKLLEGNRTLEDLRAIVQTTIAMRRIIGNRTLAEFSEVVAATYNLLQALSEGFDPGDKLVDSLTIRNELDARAAELPQEQRPVLSTNLRELAQLVTFLSENRSKPGIIRSDDAIERQLVTGEVEPQSAIDVMRWLSGYLDGIQKDKNDD